MHPFRPLARIVSRLLVCALWLFVMTSPAKDFYVDPRTGDDHADGLSANPAGNDGPVKTIARGLKLAGPGDTVHLAPVVFYESALFHNRSGEAGKPITLDGHGATLDGSEPLQSADWQSVAPGLYRNDHLLKLDDAIFMRWYFLFDGHMQRMGRTSKGPKAPLKKPEELQAGEWTFVPEENSSTTKAREIKGAFYVKIDPTKQLADYHVAIPVRSSGVGLSGTNAHLVIRHITSTHVHNDGFNIHGSCRDIHFENIRAAECGDDGFSAHDDCQTVTDGFVSIGNSTGICDIGNSVTEYDHVFIRDCHGYDLFFLEHNRHTVRNTRILSTAARTIEVNGGHTTNLCSLVLDNVLVQRAGGSNEVRVTKGALLDAQHVTLVGLNVQALGGTVRWFDSAITGAPATDLMVWPDAHWEGDRNLFALHRAKIGTKWFTEATFADFQAVLKQEAQSHWTSVPLQNGLPENLPPGTGANLANLPSGE